MSKDVSLAVVTAVLGLLTAGVLALINNWINIRAGVDENLRSRRLDQYPALWLATAVVSRWHAGAAQAAKVRLARAKPTMDTTPWQQEAGQEGARKESAPGSATT